MILDPGEFIKLVGEMRAAQKDYYKQKKPSALIRAKELEQQVDQVIDHYNKATRKQEGQARLFDDEVEDYDLFCKGPCPVCETEIEFKRIERSNHKETRTCPRCRCSVDLIVDCDDMRITMTRNA